MKRLLLALVALIALSLMVASCSDDDEDSIVGSLSTLGFVHGSVYLSPYAYIDAMMVLGNGAIPPNIDSIKLGDSLMWGDDFFDYNYDEEYHENWWEVSFSEDGSNYMYEHGDMALMRFWGNGRYSSCSFKILDADSAEISILSPGYDDDTVTAVDPVEVVWEKSDGADYYSIWIEFGMGNDVNYIYHYTYTMDTTYTVTPAMYPDSLVRMYINVTPFTGPNPATGASNLTGNYLQGKVYSFGWYDYTRVQGWYDPTPPKKAGVVDIKDDKSLSETLSPAEIIENLYKQYEK